MITSQRPPLFGLRGSTTRGAFEKSNMFDMVTGILGRSLDLRGIRQGVWLKID
jgi:hypothetical protein